MISVFRIYLGQAWRDHAATAGLRALLDTLPEFLHTVMVLPPDTAAATGLAADARRAAARVAMTQAHVAVLWGGRPAAHDAWTDHEVHIARTGFRRRIPILAVVPPQGRGNGTLAIRAADRVEPWQAADIACAVQELAESAAAERRSFLRQLAIEAETGVPATLSWRETAASAVDKRALPTEKIAEAFNQFRAGRDDDAPAKGPVGA